MKKLKNRLNPLKSINNNSGIALLVAIFAFVLMFTIATEVSYDTTVEYTIASQQVQRIKAYYAAKSGLELSLLRVQLYKAAMVALGDTLGPQKQMLDLIWQFPLTWPPAIPEKAKVTEVDKSQLKSAVEKSLMDAQYATTITGESGKINLNNLGSEVKAIKESTKSEVLKIFDNEMRTNDEFRRRNAGVNFEEIVNWIMDWVSAGNDSANGGDKMRPYDKFPLTDSNKDFIPARRPFKTMDELHMVAGMKDEYFKLLEDRVTIYGIDGVNVNYAPKDVLMSLDASFTEEAANAVIKRRQDPKEGGPFPPGDECDKQFLNFVSQYGVNVRSITDSKILLICEPEFNFRVTSTGLFQKAKREIMVITFDLDNLPGRLADALNKQDQAANQGPTASQTQAPATQGQPNAGTPAKTDDKKNKMKAPKGRPTVVYWEET